MHTRTTLVLFSLTSITFPYVTFPLFFFFLRSMTFMTFVNKLKSFGILHHIQEKQLIIGGKNSIFVTDSGVLLASSLYLLEPWKLQLMVTYYLVTVALLYLFNLLSFLSFVLS